MGQYDMFMGAVHRLGTAAAMVGGAALVGFLLHKFVWPKKCWRCEKRVLHFHE